MQHIMALPYIMYPAISINSGYCNVKYRQVQSTVYEATQSKDLVFTI